jgi:hypothetical protein
MRGKLKNSIRLQPKKVCSSGKRKREMGTSTGHGAVLDRTSKFWPKIVSVILNQSMINHGVMTDVQN